MKLLFFFAAFVVLMTSCSQPNHNVIKIASSKLDTTQIPKSVKYKGLIDTAVKFTDGDGDHVVLTTHDYDGDPANNRLNAIYLNAYCYSVNNAKWTLAWQLHDFTRECEFDLSGGFEPYSFEVTDLNHDGRAEIWVMYDMACRSDMSPSDLKLIMHEGTRKYAMRGSSSVRINGTDREGGDYEFDVAFKNGAEVFKKHAQEMWKKYKDEK